MPWYRTGTVSVALDSNAVIGTGTAFVANSRVGDAFLGPDGGWYEVTNIASDSAMSIAPNYRGATNAAGVYALTPVQGYTKDLADQARAMIQQWGSTLAGLGSVSTENIVPVTKGGTGATTQADARTGLGLGTAATRTVGTAATNLMEVGAGGWLGTSTDSASSINDYQTSFKSINPSTGGASDVGMQYGGMLTLSYSQSEGRVCQLFFGQIPSGELKFRSGIATSSPILTVYHTGNTTRAADGTLKAI